MTLIQMLGIFLTPLAWPFLLYVILQIYLPLRTRGTSWFWWSLLPLLGSLPILWLTYESGRRGDNLWPLFLILGGEAFAAYETLLLLLLFSLSEETTPRRLLRSTLAVIIGFVVMSLTVRGLESGFVTLINGGRTTDLEAYFAVRNMGGFLAGKLLYNTAAAIAAGYLTARIAGYAEMKHGAVLAVVQTLAFGLAITQPDMARWTPGWMWAALIVLTFAGVLVGAGYRAKKVGAV